jgi:ElaB/YqjD/DUF883 family membrane-anchored ribosome-binding protein
MGRNPGENLMKDNTAAAVTNADHVQHSMEKGVKSATGAAHDSIRSMSDLAHPALDNLASNAHDAVDRAGVAATHAAKTLGAKGDQLNAGGKRAIERAGAFVNENPVASLGMAVAFGYLLSRLVSSR